MPAVHVLQPHYASHSVIFSATHGAFLQHDSPEKASVGCQLSNKGNSDVLQDVLLIKLHTAVYYLDQGILVGITPDIKHSKLSLFKLQERAGCKLSKALCKCQPGIYKGSTCIVSVPPQS